MSSILPKTSSTPAAPILSPSSNSPAKGIFDRFLESPQTSPSSTPRPPTEAQRRVRGLVEKFELQAKSVTSPPPSKPAGLRGSFSSRSLKADAEDEVVTSPTSALEPSPKEEQVVVPVAVAEEASSEQEPEALLKKSSGLLSDLAGIISPRPVHAGASTPFNPDAIISAPSPALASAPSPALSSRPNSPLVEPEPLANPITSLTSANLEPPSEASPVILSPIREVLNPLAAKGYGFPHQGSAEEEKKNVVNDSEELKFVDVSSSSLVPLASRPPRQPSPEPEPTPEPAPAPVEVQVVEVTPSDESSTPSSSASNSQPPSSSSTSETPTPSSPLTTSSDPIPTPNPEGAESKESVTPTPTAPEPTEPTTTTPTTVEPASVEAEAEVEPRPLTHRHTLFFSDTSPTKKASGSTSAAYEHGLQPLFTCGTVEEFCEGWKTLRGYLAKTVGSEEGLGGLKQDSNFHFFLENIAPMWEDPMNKLGGRLTISLPTNLLDSTFSALVLLLVGSIIEIDALPTQESHGGICGVVASRRQRGDRIEVWLGGPEEPNGAWVERVKEVLARELGMPEIENGRYKKHFG